MLNFFGKILKLDLLSIRFKTLIYVNTFKYVLNCYTDCYAGEKFKIL